MSNDKKYTCKECNTKTQVLSTLISFKTTLSKNPHILRVSKNNLNKLDNLLKNGGCPLCNKWSMIYD